MKCHFCNIAKPDVEVVADPYAADVNDEVWLIPLCGDCYSDRCEEI
ncbi:hypothetical protein ACFV1L_25645 [Kitasatospora sp. NPDC059646]